jgi:TRAP-type uncharacterized transport system substrate-binding protein
MKSLVIAGVVALVWFHSPLSANAADVTLCSGKQGGGYDGLMQGVGTELQKQGHTVTINNLDGSEAILNALEAGTCAYGPAQADIYYKLGKDDPGFVTVVRPAAALYAEVMTMLCTKESGIDELSDITDKNTVIVDTIGSGSALTWDNMVEIEKKFGNGSSWAKAKTNNTPLDEAEAAMSVGEAQCAFGVAALPAMNWAKPMEQDGVVVAYIYDKDLNDLEFPKGTPLYNPLRVPRGAYLTKFDTYKINAVLFKSAKVKTDPQISKLILRVAQTLGKRKDTTD